MASPSPVPPYLRLVAGVGLLERLEDDPLLFRRDADAGVATPRTRRPPAHAQHGMLRVPAAVRRRDAEGCTPPCVGELERVRQQVLQHLLQALGVGDDAAAELGSTCTSNDKLAAFGFVPERPRHRFEQVGEDDFFGIDRHRAGFDLGQIENVADEVQQIGARAVDRARELDLLAASGCHPGSR